MLPADATILIDRLDQTTDGVVFVAHRGAVQVEVCRQGRTYFLHASELRNGQCSYTIGQWQAPHVKGALLMARGLLMNL